MKARFPTRLDDCLGETRVVVEQKDRKWVYQQGILSKGLDGLQVRKQPDIIFRQLHGLRGFGDGVNPETRVGTRTPIPRLRAQPNPIPSTTYSVHKNSTARLAYFVCKDVDIGSKRCLDDMGTALETMAVPEPKYYCQGQKLVLSLHCHYSHEKESPIQGRNEDSLNSVGGRSMSERAYEYHIQLDRNTTCIPMAPTGSLVQFPFCRTNLLAQIQPHLCLDGVGEGAWLDSTLFLQLVFPLFHDVLGGTNFFSFLAIRYDIDPYRSPSQGPSPTIVSTRVASWFFSTSQFYEYSLGALKRSSPRASSPSLVEFSGYPLGFSIPKRFLGHCQATFLD
ncbi:hypothetical protein ACRALDRAFT_206122 [Sodiomyces alcalophilus JCM 7366]|uniref:uncharacterized protein n=1 Tax=Sodiomyces alcalophilus JCM 7366 TaxID=591952 RepID=UPI0039B4F975